VHAATSIQWQQVAYGMLSVCLHAAPNGKVQQAFSRLAAASQLNGATHTEIVLLLAGALGNGIRFGVWPE